MAWAVLSGSLLTNLVLVCQERARSAIAPPVARGLPDTIIVTPSPVPSAVTRERSLSDCLERLVPLEAKARKLSEELRGILPPHKLFRLGEPNHEAETLLGPIVERVVNHAVVVTNLDLTFECRDVVCELTIVKDSDDDSSRSRVQAALQSDGELRSWVTSLSFRGVDRANDVLTHRKVIQERIYLRIIGRAGDVGEGVDR